MSRSRYLLHRLWILMVAVLFVALASLAYSKIVANNPNETTTANNKVVLSEREMVEQAIANGEYVCLAQENQACNPYKQRITVANRYGVSNNNITYFFGEICRIKEAGKLTIVASSETSVLVEYETPGNIDVGGTSCASGTLFYIEHALFNSLNEEYLEVVAQRQNDIDLTLSLLNQQ